MDLSKNAFPALPSKTATVAAIVFGSFSLADCEAAQEETKVCGARRKSVHFPANDAAMRKEHAFDKRAPPMAVSVAKAAATASTAASRSADAAHGIGARRADGS